LANKFKGVLRSGQADGIPVWFMRQAGRYMKSYSSIRENYSMNQLCKDYTMAARVSYLPVEELGVDAAIVFSDILLILENMGYSVDYPGNGSPIVSKTEPDVDQKFKSHAAGVIEKFRQIHGDFPIIGFTGAPLTILSYAMNGRSDPELMATRKAIAADDKDVKGQIEILKEYLIMDIREQIRAGAEAIQIFDSWLGFLPYSFVRDYYSGILQEITSEIHSAGSKLILFSTGTHHLWEIFREINPDALSIDWRSEICHAQEYFGKDMIIQGNLDPAIAASGLGLSLMQTRKILQNLKWNENYIFNLGHGVLPETDQATLKGIAEEVHAWKIKNE
jgi:uroporphyrinogen decarboxylase